MLLPVILLALAVPGGANDVTRDFFGDIFRMRDCHNGSRCDSGGRRPALQVPGRPCYCQCAPTHLAYREDKQQCVKDIKECYMSVFYRPFTVEAIPLVYLPTSGQLVHPDAHLSLSMRRNFEGGMAKCRVTVSQYLTREGWRTLTKVDGTGGSVFGLFTDANKTYLQFLGTSHDRKLLQQHMVLVRLLCIIPQYPAFETCVAVRIGWVPGVENIEDVSSPSNKANMMVVGLSLGVLALVYVFAVLVYLKIRRQMIAKQKASIDQEAKLQNREDNADKVSTLHRLESSNRLELYHTASLGRQKSIKKGCRNNCDPWNQMSPVVETYNRTWTDRMGQHSSEFRAQDFKLQPEFFEPEFMASPPHEVLEYLERLQNSITFARHRMRSCYRYQPTLNGIPEDDYFYQELEKKDAQDKDIRTTPDGGSASSVASLPDSPDQRSSDEHGGIPKIPPRKPKRKNIKDKSGNSSSCSPESAQSSDQEQKEIQNAMNTLNDTLNALEYDMYKQEMMNHASDSETANLSCQNSTSIDFDDFETSSCSSLSAVTVLGRDAKRQSDISKCSQFMEKNQSEDFSTFSNSTYSLCDAMRGLFHDGNKSSCNNDSERSNMSSRCPSQAGYLSQAEENSGVRTKDDGRLNINKDECDNSAEHNKAEEQALPKTRPRSQLDNVSNFSAHKNNRLSPHSRLERKHAATPNKEIKLENSEENVNKSDGTPSKITKHFHDMDNEHKERNSSSLSSWENVKTRRNTPTSVDNEQRNSNSSNEVTEVKNASSPVQANEPEDSSNQQSHIRNIRTPNAEEYRHENTPSPNLRKADPENIKSPIAEGSQRKSIRPSNNDRRSFRNSEDSTYQKNILPNLGTNEHRNIKTPDSGRNSCRTSKSPNVEQNKLGDNQLSSNPTNSDRNIKTPTSEKVRNRSNKSLTKHRLTPDKESKLTDFAKNQEIDQERLRKSSNTPNLHSEYERARTPNDDSERINTPTSEHKSINIQQNRSITPCSSNSQNECRNASDSESHSLRKSPSSESMNTVATDMTVDSLDSRCSTPSHPSPTPSLMEMWINKLVSTSVPYSKNRRKSKKKLILPEDEVESWEHVCQKHKDLCPTHDLNDSEPNLIDKLAHYSSKTMAGCDVAGYFQSLKQDVLKEHLKQWLGSNNQSKRNKNGISLESNGECSHKRPLVNGQETNLVDENGMHNNVAVEAMNDLRLRGQDHAITEDSLESDSMKLKANGNIYFSGLKQNNEKTVET